MNLGWTIYLIGVPVLFILFLASVVIGGTVVDRNEATTALIENAIAAIVWPISVVVLTGIGLSRLVLHLSLKVRNRRFAKHGLNDPNQDIQPHNEVFDEAPWGDYEDIHYEAY